MEKNNNRGYDRYGLRGNPFRDLSSETLEDVEIYHVKQDFDDDIRVIKEDVFEGVNKAVIAVLGGNGVGKTHQLLLVYSEAKRNNFFSVFKTMDEKASSAVKSIINEILKQADLGAFDKAFSAPKWYKDLTKISKNLRKYTPEIVGKAIASALNENKPSVLLINDLNRFKNPKSLNRFIRVIRVISDNLDPGVLVMLGSEKEYFERLMQTHPSMDQRINKEIIITGLSDEEAALILAKRLLEMRLVDDMDPLFPFSEEAVRILNDYSNGNPRTLLKLASSVMDYAAQNKAMSIDDELTDEALKSSRNKRLSVDYNNEEKKVVSKKQNFSKPSKKLSSQNIIQVSPVMENSGCSQPVGDSEDEPVSVKIEEDEKSDSKKENNETVENQEQNSEKTFDKGSVKNNNVQVVKVKCPKCSKIFTFECTEEKQKMQCPNSDCDFTGVINLSQYNSR